jgi:hypothetical protein
MCRQHQHCPSMTRTRNFAGAGIGRQTADRDSKVISLYLALSGESAARVGTRDNPKSPKKKTKKKTDGPHQHTFPYGVVSRGDDEAIDGYTVLAR